jgi:hypothetical protein
MERIFANLYRCGSTPNRRGLSHSYLLVRKEGNLLICHQTGPSAADIKEIKKLGGIDKQFLCHNHDTLRDGLHEELHAKFGCELYHHEDERKKVRRKTKCPQVTFDEKGLQLGSDFEALYFPACSEGHSIYRWKSRGKYFMITSHSMYIHDDKWDIQCRIRPAAAKVAKLHVDYVFPGYTGVEDESFYRINDKLQKSFGRTIRAKLKSAA